MAYRPLTEHIGWMGSTSVSSVGGPGYAMVKKQTTLTIFVSFHSVFQIFLLYGSLYMLLMSRELLEVYTED
jgi:hypothetical protein